MVRASMIISRLPPAPIAALSSSPASNRPATSVSRFSGGPCAAPRRARPRARAPGDESGLHEQAVDPLGELAVDDPEAVAMGRDDSPDPPPAHDDRCATPPRAGATAGDPGTGRAPGPSTTIASPRARATVCNACTSAASAARLDVDGGGRLGRADAASRRSRREDAASSASTARVTRSPVTAMAVTVTAIIAPTRCARTPSGRHRVRTVPPPAGSRRRGRSPRGAGWSDRPRSCGADS